MAGNARVVMYGTEHCPYCLAARMLLKKKGIAFDDISVSGDAAQRQKMEAMSGHRTVPQVFVDGKPIGGFDELDTLDRDGELDRLLGRSP